MWELDHQEGWVPKNLCFRTVGLEKTLESSLDCKEIKPVNSKGNQPWIFIGRTDAKLKLQYFGCLMWRANSLEKTLMLGKMKAGGEGGNRGWDGWMASLTQLTWVWVNSGSWWWAGRPGVLQSMGWQRVGHDWMTELNWSKLEWEMSPIVWWLAYSLVLPTFLEISRSFLGQSVNVFVVLLYCLYKYKFPLWPLHHFVYLAGIHETASFYLI